jgi:HsdM N-terminal domain
MPQPPRTDEYLAENMFWVPKEARWSHLQANAKQPGIGKLIDEAMPAIEMANSGLKGVLPKDYNRPALDKVMLAELIDFVSGSAMGEQPWPRLRIFPSTLCAEWNGLSNEALPVQAMVLLYPKEVPLCLTGTVSRICWRSCTGTLLRRLTQSHSIVGALSMGICQWD